jgi:hypothetical protein
MSEDRCVCCGVIIPEGTQVCINCQNGCVESRRDDKVNSMACGVKKGALNDSSTTMV